MVDTKHSTENPKASELDERNSRKQASSRDDSKGREGKKRNRRKDKKMGERSSPGKNGIPWKNDWTFYASSEAIAKQIASVPFNVLNGVSFPFEVAITKESSNAMQTKPTPAQSIMVVEFHPSIGVTTKRTDGVNMAAVQLFTYVRHANSGAKNYEAADLMMYVLGMEDIYASFFKLKMALGVAKWYDYYNHTTPDLILSALGFNPDDIRSNMANYTAQLNLLAEKINSFAVPKYFKAFERSAYINSFIFADSTSFRGQFYVFRKAGYYVWDPTSSPNGTSLEYNLYRSADNSYPTFTTYLETLEEQLNAMFLDEDAITMSGDILKAFGENSLYTVATDTPSNYTVVPKFDEDILAQIENAITPSWLGTGCTVNTASMTITQDNQLIDFQPYTTAVSFATGVLANYVLNSHKDEPAYTDVLEWTRLMTTFDFAGKSPTSSSVNITSTGHEIANRLLMYRYSDANNIVLTVVSQRVPSTGTTVLAAAVSIIEFMQYDWHPALYYYSDTASEAQVSLGMDLKVATSISMQVAKRINASANYSLYYARDLYNRETKTK